ncbi:hypothetical protein Sste5346_002251 [Sporothrix stenoceras]|uniref:Uncharacterized protein n=1 Tax=Sporothrix stenoceras TaxID=5173 RepID=A0ABR3ZIK4_9PEZI
MSSVDGAIPLGTFVSVGLGQPAKWLIFETPALSTTARTTMMVAGAALLAIGASSDLFIKAALALRRVDWRRVGKHVIHLSECSRWFFTVVSISREVYKRW